MATEIDTPATSDAPDTFESKETSHALPVGWLVLFFGLIAWGAYYLYAYTPALGGWSQAGEYEGTVQAGNSVLTTIACTVVPALALVGILLASRRKRSR